MFQGLIDAGNVGDMKMEVTDEETSSDLASREACFCLFIKFAKEVIWVLSFVAYNYLYDICEWMNEWMNTYIYIAPVKQKSSEALAAE